MSDVVPNRQQPLLVPFTPDRPLLHVHLPKCGGMSVDRLLWRSFPVGEVRRLEHHPSRRDENLSGLGRHACYSGHVAYRFRDHLPAETVVFTFLRNPIDRALSAYHYFRWLGPSGIVTEGAPRSLARCCELSLVDFLQAEPDVARAHMGNVQTWMLARNNLPTDANSDPLTPADLTAACRALDEMDFVGLTERFSDSVAGLCLRCGWPPPDTPDHVNRTPDRPARSALDPASLAALQELTSLDEELYRHGVKLFTSQRPIPPITPYPPFRMEIPFSGPIPGDGWHDREAYAGGYFCWTRRVAWVEGVCTGSGPLHVAIDVVAAVDASLASLFEVRVNGHLVSLTRNPRVGGGLRATGILEAPPREGNRYRVEVRVPHTFRPCDLQTGSADTRELGIAVTRIELTHVTQTDPGTGSRGDGLNDTPFLNAMSNARLPA